MSGGFPDGIAENHITPSGRVRGLRWFPLILLGAVLTAALLGLFGGGQNPVRRAETPDAALAVKAPEKLRNGEFFEISISGTARRPVMKPVIAVSRGYWQDLTINTMVPAPASERFDEGYFLFEFDPLDAGQAIEFKVDGQVNPTLFGGTSGTVQLRDDTAVLADIPIRLTVLP